jgi:hypothetical protein
MIGELILLFFTRFCPEKGSSLHGVALHRAMGRRIPSETTLSTGVGIGGGNGGGEAAA